eukprot:tig00020556_g11024.t1
MTARAFNCSVAFYDVADGTSLYVHLDEVAAAVLGGSVSFVPTSDGPVQSTTVITVQPATDPPAGLSGSIAVHVKLTSGQILGSALVPIVYVADNSSSVACTKVQVALGEAIDCTLTPRRLREPVWVDAASIGFNGDVALAPIAGTLTPATGPVQSLSFQMTGQSPAGSLLTGPSVAMVFSNGVSIANASAIVYTSPDDTSNAVRMW